MSISQKKTFAYIFADNGIFITANLIKAKPPEWVVFIMVLVYLCNEKFFVSNKCIIDFTKTVKFSLIFSLNDIKGKVHIPPRAIKVDPVPSMVILVAVTLITIDNKARNVLTPT